MNISFVILHYNAIKDTIACINSIKANIGIHSPIIVVDNNSPNNTGIELKNLYQEDNQVHIILNTLNEGFAKGNNLGFVYAKQNFSPDFIVMLNNDTLILQKNFQQLVEEEFYISQFAVLGPTIETPHRPYTSNPGPNKLPSISHFYKYLFKIRLKYFLNYLFLDGIYELVFHKFSKKKQSTEDFSKKENVILHGSALIFSKEYISRFNGLNPKTFLYQEERLLFLRLQQNKLKSVYQPNIRIFHKEDVATGTISNKKRLKRRFCYKCYIQSVKILINAMKNGNA